MRAVRAAIANFKGGAGKSTVALHFAHAAALDGYRVLCVDFDPQATLSHSMGLTDVSEEHTVWGIMARDLIRETEAQNNAPRGAASGTALPRRTIPAAITDLGLHDLRVPDFIQRTNWPTIDLIPSCANAAFVEFASAQYRHLNPEWSFFAAVSRFLDQLPDDQWDLIFFDCPPAIGYQSMNAVFAADMLYIPSGPGYWEYDSTTSFIGQLSEALEDLAYGFEGTLSADKVTLPKAFHDVRFLLTRYEPGNDLHRAMFEAFGKVFGDRLAQHPVDLGQRVGQTAIAHRRFSAGEDSIGVRSFAGRDRAGTKLPFQETAKAAFAFFRHGGAGGGQGLPRGIGITGLQIGEGDHTARSGLSQRLGNVLNPGFLQLDQRGLKGASGADRGVHLGQAGLGAGCFCSGGGRLFGGLGVIQQAFDLAALLSDRGAQGFHFTFKGRDCNLVFATAYGLFLNRGEAAVDLGQLALKRREFFACGGQLCAERVDLWQAFR